MIRSWTLGHFKSVYAKTPIEMAPLTVFAGANSSGKSTLIQSILLATQTLQSPVRSRPIVLNGHIVRLGAFNDILSNMQNSGEISIGFQLSPFVKEDDIASSALNRQYYSYYHQRLLRSISAISCNFKFSATGSEEKEILQLQPVLEESSLEVTYSSHVGRKRKPSVVSESILVKRSGKSIRERAIRLKLTGEALSLPELTSLEYEVSHRADISESIYGYSFSKELVGASLNHFLPGKFSYVFDKVEAQTARLLDMIITPERFPHRSVELIPDDGFAIEDYFVNNSELKKIYIETYEAIYNEIESQKEKHANKVLNAIAALKKCFSYQEIHQQYSKLYAEQKYMLSKHLSARTIEIRKSLRLDRKPNYSLMYFTLPDVSESAVDYTQNFFTKHVKYLGPLRDEPKPVYPIAAATDSRDVGFKGEHTAAVLEVHKNTQIQYVPTKYFEEPGGRHELETTTLQVAVLDWLQYMGIASGVTTADKGKLGHELKIATSSSDLLHDLTHVGVGVSQVLPLLVLSLLADQGSTLIFEQPELHLHPRIQTRLADFFISMTMLNKQCIVETHSEYLISRIRYQAAISRENEVSDSVIIYFVEKISGQSKYMSVRMNKFGVIENWPKGFFDEGQENAASILKAAMEKRRAVARGK